jgi:hypothetical protein
LPVWTVAAGALALLVCALLLVARFGDKARRSDDSSPGASEAALALVQLLEAGTDEGSSSIAASGTRMGTEVTELGTASGVAALPNLGVTDLAGSTDAAVRARAGIADFVVAPADSVAAPGQGRATTGGPSDGAVLADATSTSDAAVAAERAPEPRRESSREAGGPQMLCGNNVCPVGQVCCNASCGTCTPPGGTCSQQVCGAENLPLSAPCGPNTCNVGQVCCNPSCGICTPPGGTCDTKPCDGPKVPFSVPCGLNTCNVGQVCCNPSCGICVAPGESCRTDPCP